MKVCHVITRLIIGGAQENTLLTCRGLAERGHQVTLVAGPETGPEGSLWDQTRAQGYSTHRLDALRRAVRPDLDWRALRALRKLIRELRPDVVHTHSSKAGILGRQAAAAEGVPCTVHTIHGMSFNRTQSRTAFSFYRWLERRAAPQTTWWITVADAMIEQAVAAGVAPRERFITIRSGMETGRFAPDPVQRRHARAAWGFGPEIIVVGTVARLFRNKGYEDIIAAMPKLVQQVPSAAFVWIGDGSDRAAYEQKLNALGLRERVHLAGLVPPGEINRWLNGFDLLVHASRWEGLPRAAVEGLLTEIPVVSFDNDGAPEVVRHGETGLLVPLGDTQKLAEAAARLAADSELRTRLGRQGRQHCLAEFDWRTMVKRIEQVYARRT